MKKIITTLIVILNLDLANAQSIIDTVNFNNYVSISNNDLQNYFSNTSWITQDTMHGITGGSLNTPNTLSWGNDVIWYCKNYTNVIDSMLVTSISFKWNSSLINTITYDRAAAIFVIGDVINHTVAYYLNRDQTLTIITYGDVQNTLISLTSGHWYRLVASYRSLSTPPGDNVYARAEIFDLGTNGLSSPISVGSNTLMLHDSDLVNSSQFGVRVSGAKWGGGEYLDNFTFQGIPGTVNCAPVNVNENLVHSAVLNIYPQPASEIINISINVEIKELPVFFSITDVTGRKKLQGKSQTNRFSIPVKELASGIYFMQLLHGAEIIINKQIVID